jgi:hypothetical protein
MALALIMPVAALAQQSVMHRGDLTVSGQRVVGDVVVADGDLVVKGRVTGSVFVSNGDVLVSPGAVVEGHLTVLGGSLWVSRGAGVAGEINIFSGKAHIEKGARVNSHVRALEEVSSLTDEKLALVSRYILFNRKAPPPSLRLENLSKLDLSMLRLKRVRGQAAVQLDLAELGEMPLSLDGIADSRELVYRGHDMWVGICVIRFASGSQAENFWDKLREKFEEEISYSVHNSLGEGAHWFFRYRGASYCLWQEGQTLQAVIVLEGDDDPDDDEWEEIENMRDRIILELKNFYELAGQ